MLNHKLQFPTFDILELTTELEYSGQTYSKLKPARPGDFSNGLSQGKNKWHPFFDENVFNQTGTTFSYTKKPLVLYFYSAQWGAISIAHLKQLNSQLQQIQYHQGNLLLITDNEDDIKQALWDYSLSLPYYNDPKHDLAHLLGIYDDNSPAWNRYAGVDQNVPLPSVYVLDGARQVAFAYANEDLLTGLPLNYITEAVYQSNKYLSAKKSA